MVIIPVAQQITVCYLTLSFLEEQPMQGLVRWTEWEKKQKTGGAFLRVFGAGGSSGAVAEQLHTKPWGKTPMAPPPRGCRSETIITNERRGWGFQSF